MSGPEPHYCVLPGAGGSGLSWAQVLEPLNATLLEVPDERDVPAMAAAIAKSVHELPRPLVLVGASLGAMVALELARTVPVHALVLIAIAWCFDEMARRVSRRAARWRTGGFVYHPDHDAWVCPQDHWLWPTSFDPQHRVMRYRASPVVCNSCPVKSDCTTSEHGRELSREVDPWPYSDSGRFHRGIA